MKIAPISISVYDRIEHLKKCVESLKKNSLATQSTLYIFSDAAKKGDEHKILEIRNYIDEIRGFKQIRRIYQPFNDMEANMRMADLIPLNDFGSVIRMEDDIEVSNRFLDYMNQALSKYENNDDIFMVSGYTETVNERRTGEVGAMYCMNASGVGLWRNKFYKFYGEYKDLHPFIRLKNNYFLKLKFLLKFGLTRYLRLKKIYLEDKFHGDLLIGEYMYRKKLLTVFPPYTQTINNGHDGSGYNCPKNDKLMRKFIKNDCDIYYPDYFDREVAENESNKYLNKWRPKMRSEIKAAISLLLG